MSSKAKPKKFSGKFFRMKVDLDKIKKLPPDIKKDFMKLYLKHAEKKKPKVDDSEPEADSPGTGPEARGSGASGPEESGASGDDESGSESGASGPEKDDESGPAAAKKF